MSKSSPPHLRLDAIILDDDPQLCKLLEGMFGEFYDAGEVHAFTDFYTAVEYCNQRSHPLALFVVDVYLGDSTAFDFIKAIETRYPMASDDMIIITGNADREVVRKCMEAKVNHLLEKPVRLYAFQFAVLAILNKYKRFAPRLLHDPVFASRVVSLDEL